MKIMDKLSIFLRRIFTKQKKKASSAKKSKSKYYSDLEIPAKLFFEILENQDVSKLIIKGEPNQDNLLKAWDNIFDLYFKEKDDQKLELILRKQASIMLTTYTIDMYKRFVTLLHHNPFSTEQLLEFIESLKVIKLRINTKNNLNDEILKVLKQTIPSLEIKLQLEKGNLQELTKGKKMKFYDALAAMTKSGGVQMNPNITLGYYIAYEKQLSKKTVMADATFIDIISPKAIQDVGLLLEKVSATVVETAKLQKQFKQITLPSQLASASKSAEESIKKTNKALTESEKLTKKLRLENLKLQKQREAAFDKYEAGLKKEKKQRESQVNSESKVRESLARQKKKESDQDQRDFQRKAKQLEKEKQLREAQVNKESTLRQRLLAQRKKQEAAAARSIKLAEKEAQTQKKAAAISKELGRSFNVATRKRNELAKVINDLNVKRSLGVKLSKKEASLLARSSRSFKRYNKAVNNASRGVGRFHDNVGNYPKGAMRGAIQSVKSLASALGLMGGAFLFVSTIRNAIGVIRDYEKQNATLASVLQKTTEETAELRAESQRLGATTVKTATEVTALQIEYARLGFSQQEIIDLTAATIDGSIAMNAELSETAKLAGAMVNTFDQFSATDAPEILDILSLATAKSALDFQKLNTALPIVSGAANAAGVPFTKLVALLGKLADSGIDASSSSTALRNIFIESAAQGLSYEQILEKIKKSQDKLTAANDEFGKRAAVSATVLSDNIDKTKELDEALQGAAGTAGEMAEKELNTLDGALKLLESAWQGVILGTDEANGITEKITKAVIYLADNLDKIISTVYKVGKAWVTYKLVLVATSLITRAYTGTVIALRVAKIALSRGIGSATKAMGLFNTVSKANVIGALSAALAVAVGLWVGFKDGVNSSIEALKEMEKQTKKANKAIIENDLALIQSQLNRIDQEEKNETKATQKKIDAINQQQKNILSGKADLYDDASKIVEEGEKKETELTQEAQNERMKMLLNNQDSVQKILKEGLEKGKKLRIATNKEVGKLLGEAPVTKEQELREKRAKALEDLKKKLIKQLAEIADAEAKAATEGKKASKGKAKALEFENVLHKKTNEGLKEQIKLWTDIRDKVTIGSAAYKFADDMIKSLSESSEELGENGLKAFESYAEGLKRLKKEAEDSKEAIENFLNTFTDDIIGSSGFETTFAILSGELEGFGTDWAVTTNAILESTQEMFNFIDQFSQASFEKRVSNLQQEKDIALLLAGDSAEAKERIEKQYEERVARLEAKRAKQKKNLALFNIGIDTAQGIVSTIGNVGFPAAIPLIALIAAIGVAQAALVSSAEIPQFKDGHLAGTHSGLALVNDGGRDEFLERRGQVHRITGRNVLLDMQKGDKIHKSEQSMHSHFNTELNNELLKNGIYAQSTPINPQIKVVNQGITKGEMQNVLRSELGRNSSSINFDKRGFSQYSANSLAKSKSLNNKVTFKGASV